MSNSKSVEDMLRDGATMDSLVEDLKKQIVEAQERIDKEKSTIPTRLDYMRKEAAAALFNYLEELGVIELDDSEKEGLLETAEETVKELEPEIKKYAKIMNILLDLDSEEEMEKPFKAYVPKSLTKYNSGTFSADVDIDAKLADLLKKIM